MKVRIVWISFFLLLPSLLFAQKGYNDQINRYNDKGQKEGYWIEDRGSDRIETYYENGKKTGLFKSYSKSTPSTLRYFGEFADDKMVGLWYSFADKGHLFQIDSDFGEIRDTIRLKGNVTYYAPFKCHTKFFYPNGKIRSEGTLLYGDDPQLDGQEYGEWKYYDKNGNLTETKYFD